MTSVYHVSTPTPGSWFQINQTEHESYDRTSDRVTSVSVTDEKNMALQRQI